MKTVNVLSIGNNKSIDEVIESLLEAKEKGATKIIITNSGCCPDNWNTYKFIDAVKVLTEAELKEIEVNNLKAKIKEIEKQ